MRNFRISRPTQALLVANVLVALLITFQLTYPATASQAIEVPGVQNKFTYEITE